MGAFPFVVLLQGFRGSHLESDWGLRPLFPFSVPKQRGRKRTNMRRIMLSSLAIVCAMLLSGCGNPHEKMVKGLYAAVQSGDQKKAMENFAPGLDDMLKYNKNTKKVFRTVSESKEPVKTEIIKTLSENGGKMSIISAKCDGTTLYFVVGGEKGKDDKILFISTDKSAVMKGVADEAGGKTSSSQSCVLSEAATSKAEECTVTASTASNSIERLTPEQKVKRLMTQLRKVLGNSMEVSLALAAIQEKVDKVTGDYKTKCVLQEMFGLQNKIPGGVIPDLTDPNGNGALEKYLKEREIGGIGALMCMYHMLSDEEQKSVSDEVRKLMK